MGSRRNHDGEIYIMFDGIAKDIKFHLMVGHAWGMILHAHCFLWRWHSYHDTVRRIVPENLKVGSKKK